MSLYPITDHADQALARLAAQYRGKPRIEGLLLAFVAQQQALEDATWQLATQRGLVVLSVDGEQLFDGAVGVQLDVLGRILGLPRGAAVDDDYRLQLRAQIRVNRSSGTIPELVGIFATVEPDSLIKVLDWVDAYVTVEIAEPITAAKAAVYVGFLRKARAGGRAGTLLWQETDDAHALILSDAASYPETSALTGLGDTTDATVGGCFTGAAG